MNTQRLKDGQTDYLAMLSSPTFEALHAPQLIQMVDQGTLNADYLNTARLPSKLFYFYTFMIYKIFKNASNLYLVIYRLYIFNIFRSTIICS